MKLGICIPYRDNGDGVRKEHLDKLVPHLEKFLGDRNIDFRVYIGHQVDEKKFNRSGTKNVAFLAAKEDGCDYVAFQDVDMLPQDDCDYSHPGDTPKHIATYLSQWDYTLRDIHYFGGVVLFTIEQFENVNGYLTDYWGWGFEDDDLFWRCIQKGYFEPEYIESPGSTKVLQFDGKETHIKVPITNTTMNIPNKSCEIEAIVYSEIESDDKEFLIGNDVGHLKYPIISRKGWDFDISYNNSKAFSYCLWGRKNDLYYGWMMRYPNQWSKVNFKVDTRMKERTITINDEEYGMEFGPQKSVLPIQDMLKRYGTTPFYIGKNPPNPYDPFKERNRPFKGKMYSIKMWNDRKELVLHYDMSKSWRRDKLLDLSGNENHGELVLGKGRITKDNIQIAKTITPHRRWGTMECMYHDDEGIVNQQFQGDPEATKVNEITYKKGMQKDKIDITTNGLTDMKYEIESTQDDIYNRHKIINVRF